MFMVHLATISFVYLILIVILLFMKIFLWWYFAKLWSWRVLHAFDTVLVICKKFYGRFDDVFVPLFDLDCDFAVYEDSLVFFMVDMTCFICFWYCFDASLFVLSMFIANWRRFRFLHALDTVFVICEKFWCFLVCIMHVYGRYDDDFVPLFDFDCNFASLMVFCKIMVDASCFTCFDSVFVICAQFWYSFICELATVSVFYIILLLTSSFMIKKCAKVRKCVIDLIRICLEFSFFFGLFA